MTKLLKYQQEVKETKAEDVVLRWARRTGKDFLIDDIATDKDIVIYPSLNMARAVYGNGINIKTKNGAKVFDEGSPILGYRPNAVFIVEPACFTRLYRTIDAVMDVQPKRVFLIGTPLPSGRVMSSSFLFNALTREASAMKSDKLYFSLIGMSDNPLVPPEFIADMKKGMPDQIYELTADWSEDENKR